MSLFPEHSALFGSASVSETFNADLQRHIHGTLPKGHVYQLGMPSAILLSTGIPYLPIELNAAMLDVKSSVKYKNPHPFHLHELQNLPDAMQNPIMIFDSKTRKDSKVILIELKSKGVNFVIALQVNYNKGNRLNISIINSVRSVYPKNNQSAIIEWVKTGLLRYANKIKAKTFATELRSNCAEVGSKGLNSFAKIVQNFKNPTLSEKKSLLGMNAPEERFIAAVAENALANMWLPRSQNIYTKAREYGIQADSSQIKELYEVGIMRALKNRLTEDMYDNYLTAQKIYENQKAINLRTSTSIMLQQYSTPLPLAYLAGAYVAWQQDTLATYFEPSAGNGLLTVALPNKCTTVNEIDRVRRKNLEDFGGYCSVLNYDASRHIGALNRFDGIITNPPFGSVESEKVAGYTITKLEHIMAIRALEYMTSAGRAAIIIGGHTKWDVYGKIAGRQDVSFLCYLHKHYHVEDCINIEGKLYAKQGTTFPIRLILINGRKTTPEGTAPLKTDRDTTVRSFEELWGRVSVYFKREQTKDTDSDRRWRLARAQAIKIQLELEMRGLGNPALFQYFTGSIAELVRISKTTLNSVVKKQISKVSSKLLRDLTQKGVYITNDYYHTIDNNAIAHTLKRHGSKNECLQGQIPITETDFSKISYIINNYDTIKIEKNPRKQDVIIYSKEYADGTIYYVEEVRIGRKELAMDSMRKRKKTSPAIADYK
ncbi:MAG: hypothetical protein LBU90_07550 [Bacteroidales bacterium]|jgi:hypothetical protein|nr:hypothetical protein [Bacteroidales bacterium]